MRCDSTIRNTTHSHVTFSTPNLSPALKCMSTKRSLYYIKRTLFSANKTLSKKPHIVKTASESVKITIQSVERAPSSVKSALSTLYQKGLYLGATDPNKTKFCAQEQPQPPCPFSPAKTHMHTKPRCIHRHTATISESINPLVSFSRQRVSFSPTKTHMYTKHSHRHKVAISESICLFFQATSLFLSRSFSWMPQKWWMSQNWFPFACCLSVYLSIILSDHMSVCLPVALPRAASLSILLSTTLSRSSLSVYLPLYPFSLISVCLSVLHNNL